MPRLFTALELPRSLADELALLRGGLPGARWIEAGSYHVTLRFIGDISAGEARDVHDELARIERKPFSVVICGLGVFGGGKPRALIATIAPSAALTGLQAEQERLLRRIGLAPETRKFTPHVTLARLRRTSPSEVAFFLAGRGFQAPRQLETSRPFEATRFVLMSSRDSGGGGPYVVEAAYPLE